MLHWFYFIVVKHEIFRTFSYFKKTVADESYFLIKISLKWSKYGGSGVFRIKLISKSLFHLIETYQLKALLNQIMISRNNLCWPKDLKRTKFWFHSRVKILNYLIKSNLIDPKVCKRKWQLKKKLPIYLTRSNDFIGLKVFQKIPIVWLISWFWLDIKAYNCNLITV